MEKKRGLISRILSKPAISPAKKPSALDPQNQKPENLNQNTASKNSSQGQVTPAKNHDTPITTEAAPYAPRENSKLISYAYHSPTDLAKMDRGQINKALLKELKECLDIFELIRKEVSKVVVGQKEMVDSIILALICNGHCLIEGVPGIGKTLTVRTLSKILDCQYSRIQFTPDLLPSDIVGITAYDEKKGFYTVKGPIFSNFVLADEINRAPPKVQSALLESMQERQVTIGKETFILAEPFIVMATQNPVETIGTYSLPEAQVDRFLFKLMMKYPTLKEEAHILTQNMTLFSFDAFNLKPLINPARIKQVQNFVLNIYVDKKIEDYIVRIIDCTRNPKNYGLKMAQYISFGSSPRGTISLFIAAKGNALLNGRIYVTPQDVKEVAHIVLRHRISMNYEGQAEGINVDNIIDEILSSVPIH